MYIKGEARRYCNRGELMLYRVELSYAVFGIITQGNTIIDAAPIGKWMIGKSIMYVGEWIAKKHGTLRQIEND